MTLSIAMDSAKRVARTPRSAVELLEKNPELHRELHQMFALAVAKSYDNYYLHGARSSLKMVPIHSSIAHVLAKMLYLVCGRNHGYTIESSGYGTGKEAKLRSGFDGFKNVDLVVKHSDQPKIVVSVKAPMSSIAKNHINCQEAMSGEAVGLKNQNKDLVFAEFMVHPVISPDYGKSVSNGAKYIKKIESISVSRIDSMLHLATSVRCHKCHAESPVIDDGIVFFTHSPHLDKFLGRVLNLETSEDIKIAYREELEKHQGVYPLKQVTSDNLATIPGEENWRLVTPELGPMFDLKKDPIMDLARSLDKALPTP